MQLSKLVDPRFKKIIVALQGEVIPLKGAFKLKGIVKAIDNELNKYEELRQGALTKFGKKDADGKPVLSEGGDVQFEEDNMKEFVKELQDLLSLDVNLPKLKLEDLGEKLHLSVEDLYLIEELIES